MQNEDEYEEDRLVDFDGELEEIRIKSNEEGELDGEIGKMKTELEDEEVGECEEDLIEEYRKEAMEFISLLEGQGNEEARKIRTKLVEIKDRLEPVENETYLSQEEKLRGVRRVHEQSGHKKALKGLKVSDRKAVQEVIKKCRVCQKFHKAKKYLKFQQ